MILGRVLEGERVRVLGTQLEARVVRHSGGSVTVEVPRAAREFLAGDGEEQTAVKIPGGMVRQTWAQGTEVEVL